MAKKHALNILILLLGGIESDAQNIILISKDTLNNFKFNKIELPRDRFPKGNRIINTEIYADSLVLIKNTFSGTEIVKEVYVFVNGGLKKIRKIVGVIQEQKRYVTFPDGSKIAIE